MIITGHHWLQCITGLGKQPFCGTAIANDCTSKDEVDIANHTKLQATNGPPSCRGRQHTPAQKLLGRKRKELGGRAKCKKWDGWSGHQKSLSTDIHGPGETGETEICPSMVHCAIFVQDWLSADSHRRRTEVLTWAPIIYGSTAGYMGLNVRTDRHVLQSFRRYLYAEWASLMHSPGPESCAATVAIGRADSKRILFCTRPPPCGLSAWELCEPAKRCAVQKIPASLQCNEGVQMLCTQPFGLVS